MGSVGEPLWQAGCQLCTLAMLLTKLINELPSLQQELYKLLVTMKKMEDWRLLRADFNDDDGNTEPYIDITVGCTFDFEEGAISWNYQTGDNSYTGGAYGHPEWFTTSLLSRSNCKDLAKDLIDEIEGRIHELHSFAN